MLTGPVTLSGNPEIQSDAGSLSLSGPVEPPHLTFDGGGSTSFTGNLRLGSGAIIETVRLGRSLRINSYSGDTRINAGTLRATGGNAIGNSSKVTLADVAGATLDLAGSSETIGSLTGAGPRRQCHAWGRNPHYRDGRFNDVWWRNKRHRGSHQSGYGRIFTLTGNNTYTWLTTVSAGTLQIGNGGTSGSIAGDIIAIASWNSTDRTVLW